MLKGTGLTSSSTPPRVEELLDDIAYYRRCLTEADTLEPDERRTLQAVYAPFLARRLKLLTRLTGRPAVIDLDSLHLELQG